jgi:hypothetical protein
MNRNFGSYMLSGATLLAALCMISMHAAAQREQAATTGTGKSDAQQVKPLPPGGPTPRMADGHPNLSGVWFPGITGGGDLNDVGLDGNSGLVRRLFDPKKTPQEKPAYQPWAAAKLKQMYPTQIDVELHRPSVNCEPRGVPGMFTTNPYPLQLVTTPGQFVQLIELNNNFRVVPTDGRPHIQDPDPTFNGEGVAHWDGDTLVIDTIAIDEKTWNDMQGWFHSDEEHVIERISRPSMNYLTYQVTIEDPKVLTKPWSSVPWTWTLGHEPLEEYYCTHNEELYQFNSLKSGDSK